jgi:hypothetical protein
MSTAPRSRLRHLAAAIALPAGLVLAMIGTGSAAAGWLGSVAIVDADAGAEVIVDGQPQVCEFWFEFDLPEAVDVVGWEIREWADSPAEGTLVLEGQGGPTDADGLLRQPESGTLTLPDGRYNVLWDDEPVDASFVSRSFVVDCGEEAPVATESTPPAPTDEGTGGTQPTPSGQDLAAGGAAITAPPTDIVTNADGGSDNGLLAVLVSVVAAVVLAFTTPWQRLSGRASARWAPRWASPRRWSSSRRTGRRAASRSAPARSRRRCTTSAASRARCTRSATPRPARRNWRGACSRRWPMPACARR